MRRPSPRAFATVRRCAGTPNGWHGSRGGRQRVYTSEPVAAERATSTAMIADLFAWYLASPDRLPGTYREQERRAPVHRLICDYIAGMTDGYLRRTWEQARRA